MFFFGNKLDSFGNKLIVSNLAPCSLHEHVLASEQRVEGGDESVVHHLHGEVWGEALEAHRLLYHSA